jgi:hypothetical protein
MLLSMVVYVAIAAWLALKEVGRIDWVSMLAAPGLAAGAMTAPLIALAGAWPLALLAGAVVYAGVYAIVDHYVDPADLRFVVDLVRRRLPRRRLDVGR